MKTRAGPNGPVLLAPPAIRAKGTSPEGQVANMEQALALPPCPPARYPAPGAPQGTPENQPFLGTSGTTRFLTWDVWKRPEFLGRTEGPGKGKGSQTPGRQSWRGDRASGKRLREGGRWGQTASGGGAVTGQSRLARAGLGERVGHSSQQHAHSWSRMLGVSCVSKFCISRIRSKPKVPEIS